MNPTIVYVRTAEGERLTRSPRQIVRAHRATLLLVDGQINVGELKHRFGATLPIEEALAELERDGLVRPREESEELDAQGLRESASPPAPHGAPKPEPEPEVQSLPSLEEGPLFARQEEPAVKEEVAAEPAPVTKDERFAEPDPGVEAESVAKPYHAAEPVPAAEPEPVAEPVPVAKPQSAAKAVTRREPVVELAPVAEPMMLIEAKVEPTAEGEPFIATLPDPEPVLSDYPIPPPPEDRSAPARPEKRISRAGSGKASSSGREPVALPAWLGPKALAIAAAGLGLVAVAGVFLWLAGLRPQIEARASAALGVPVSVGSLGLAIRHGPALALRDVTIHQEPPLALARVELKPDPHQGNVWSASHVLVTDAQLQPSELGALARLLGGGEAVNEVAFENLQVRLGALQVGDLAGRLEHEGTGGAVLKLAGPGGMSVEARPSGAGLSILLAARPEVLPLLGQPRIATVELRGFLNDAGLRAGEVGMTGYGGKFEGGVEMAWAGPVSLDAKLKMTGVAMDQVSRALFGASGFAEGHASGNLNLGARAESWDQLVRIDSVTGSITVERGAFKRFDLGSVVRERAPTPAPGGETRFETLRGRVQAGPKDIRLWVDHLDAGALTASGWLAVSGLESLRGELSAVVDVPGRGAQRYPAQLSGTVAQPSVQLKPGVIAVPVPSTGESPEEQ